MTKTTVFTKGRNGNNAGCVPCKSVSVAQREQLFSDEDALPAS